MSDVSDAYGGWGWPCNLDGLAKGAKGLLDNTKYSDLVIKCEEREWKVHKAILCPQSKFFEKACEGDFIEAQENIITLRDDKPDVVNALLRWVYTGRYTDSAAASSQPYDKGVFTISVHAIADKYDMPTLAESAVYHFTSWADFHCGHADFTKLVGEIYTGTMEIPQELRKIFVSTIARNAQTLLIYQRHADFRSCVAALPELLMALSMEVATDPGGMGVALPTNVSEPARQALLAIRNTGQMHPQAIATKTGLDMEVIILVLTELREARLAHQKGEGHWVAGQGPRTWGSGPPSGNGWD